MAVPSAQEIQGQIRQQQLIGMGVAAQQQALHPMAAGGNYAPFVPQSPFQMASVQNNARAAEAPVNMGKLSLLGISFSLMLLGAFTFLGGFLMGIWVAGPSSSSYPPQEKTVYYSTDGTYSQETKAQQAPTFGQTVGKRIGAAAEAAIKDARIQGLPAALSPLIKAAQPELGKRAGEKTEDFLRQHSEMIQPTAQPYIQQQFSPPPVSPTENYSPRPYGGPAQLPVVTPQTVAAAVPSTPAVQNEGGYTIQLGVYALPENANALVNHLQILNYPSQVMPGKAPDGSKVYYVRSGFYKDYTTALSAASQFASQNIPGAIIVKISPQQKSAS